MAPIYKKKERERERDRERQRQRERKREREREKKTKGLAADKSKRTTRYRKCMKRCVQNSSCSSKVGY